MERKRRRFSRARSRHDGCTARRYPRTDRGRRGRLRVGRDPVVAQRGNAMKVVSYGECLPAADHERAAFACEAPLLPWLRLTTSSAPA